VLFTSEEEYRLAQQSFRPFQCNPVVVNYGTSVPAGDAEAQRTAFLSHYPELRDKRIALFISRIDRKKGCDLLLHAFAQVCGRTPEWHLVMAGPDRSGWMAALRRLAADLGIEERITWTGMLSGDLKWGAYRSADVFVLPSHSENFGIVVSEALACGLPVLISNKVNIWREIEDDGAGLVAADTEEGTAGLLHHWMKLPAQERAGMRQRATACFLRRFEVRRAAANLVEVLSHLHGPIAHSAGHVAAH